MPEAIMGVGDFLASTIFIWGRIIAAFFLFGIIHTWFLFYKRVMKIIEELKKWGQTLQLPSIPKTIFVKQYLEDYTARLVSDVEKPAMEALKLVVAAFAKTIIFLVLGMLFLILSFVIPCNACECRYEGIGFWNQPITRRTMT